MSLYAIIDAVDNNTYQQFTSDVLKQMLKQVDQELRDMEIYGGDNPGDFGYDLNALLDVRKQINNLIKAHEVV